MPSENFFFRSFSIWLGEILGSYSVEAKNVSSANTFNADCKLSGKSFMYISKSNGPKIEPCGSPSSTDYQLEHWPLSTSRWNQWLKILLSRRRRFLEIPIPLSLNEISKKLSLASRVGCWSIERLIVTGFHMSQMDEIQIGLNRED